MRLKKKIRSLLSKDEIVEIRNQQQHILDVLAALPSELSGGERTMMDAVAVAIQKNADEAALTIRQLNERIDFLETQLKTSSEMAVSQLKTSVELAACGKSGMLKVLIAGFYGADNLGDEFMLKAVLNRLSRFESLDITVLLYDNDGYVPPAYKDIHYVHLQKNMYDFPNLVHKFDFFIFGGGAVLDDTNYSVDNAHQYDISTILIKISEYAQASGKKTAFLGLSTSYNMSDMVYIEKLADVVSRSDVFLLRDKYSKVQIDALVPGKAELMEDIVYSLPRLKTDFQSGADSISVGVVVVDEESSKNLFDACVAFQDEIAPKHMKIKLIPMYDYMNSNIIQYGKIKEKYGSFLDIEIKNFTNSYEGICGYFSENDFNISMRYHGCVLSLMTGTPAIPVLYDKCVHYQNKVRQIIDDYNMPELLVSSVSEEPHSFVEKMMLAMNENERYRNTADMVAERLCAGAVQQMSKVINDLFD